MYALRFSTDTELDAESIYRYYKARFQIEFLFRDARQFTGLNDCQARRQDSLGFHFNASLTTKLTPIYHLIMTLIRSFQWPPKKWSISTSICSKRFSLS